MQWPLKGAGRWFPLQQRRQKGRNGSCRSRGEAEPLAGEQERTTEFLITEIAGIPRVRLREPSANSLHARKVSPRDGTLPCTLPNYLHGCSNVFAVPIKGGLVHRSEGIG